MASLLWMTDLSARADACLAPVLRLAGLHAADVIIVHAAGRSLARGVDVDAEYARRADVHLETQARELRAGGLGVEVVMDAGQPEALLTRLVEEREILLVVAGSTGVTGIDRLLLGSTANRLMRVSTVPVMLVGERGLPALGRIVCVVSDTPDPRTMQLAERLARRADASLDIVAVGRGVTAEALREVITLALPEGTSWRLRGRPGERARAAILAEAQAADLLVLSAGPGRWRRLKRDGVAQVVKGCPGCVLVVR